LKKIWIYKEIFKSAPFPKKIITRKKMIVIIMKEKDEKSKKVKKIKQMGKILCLIAA
jgi:hypothetical protein